jgi:hypothetical protein
METENQPTVTPRDAARMLAGMRRRVQKVCLRCGRPIEGVRQRKFCSPTCASAYWQKTHRDRVNASRRRRRQRPPADTPTKPEPAP